MIFFKTHSVDTGDVSSQIENGQINGQEAEDPKKRAEWEKTKNEVMRITDKLGKGLDEGIIETVVAFQVLGINTFQSCEGHVDHESESPSPYIDVATPGLEKDGKKVDKMYKIANAIRRPTYLRAAFNNLTGKAVSKDEIYHLEVQAQEMNEQLREKNAPEVQKVQGLLNEFYQDRSVAEDTRLFIDQYFIHGEGRLRPTGADELEQQIKSGSVNLEERKRKLETYQSEVAAFTTFLRNKFLKKRK